MADKKDLKEKLGKFLEEETPAQIDIIVPPPPPPLPPPLPAPAIVPEMNATSNPIMKILADLKCIGMCAKDLHYHAFGTPFYGLHLLADLVWQVEQETDDLIEAYYMGENGSEPPMLDKIYLLALNVLPPHIIGPDSYVIRLLNCCHMAINDVETAKATMTELKAGVHAALDTISQKALISVGLLTQTIKK